VKTDEFIERLAGLRRELQQEVAEAYAQRSESLRGLAAPDGVAVTATEAGAHWSALSDMALGGSRAEGVQWLFDRAGERSAVGLFTGAGADGVDAVPFVVAPIGDRIVVEATDGDDRATFVFAGIDPVRLNAVLILTNFRREAIFLSDDQLGRWAVGARTWPVIREARAALVGRVVHDERWTERVTHLVERIGG
jgi:hypothetical protein